ncbi:MAG: prolyl oligopeptidase family serine peptidase [Alphaproteobacteria bacterium]|nr:prolyl oligopeptidase family serine peptidase [Alphaproteobacteria bacterium]
MKRLLATLSAGFAILGLAGAPAQAQSVNTPPLEAFATYSAMSNVSLSPDGEHIAFMRLPARDANYIIEIYDIDNLDGRPVRLGAERMQITGFSWVSDEHLWVNFIQQVRDDIEDVNRGVFASKRAIANINPREGWIQLPDDASLVSRLPESPDEILIYTANVNQNESLEGRSRVDAFTRDFVRFNLNTERQRLVLRGNTRLGGFRLDRDGDIRFASEVNAGSREVIYYSRGKGERDQWTEFLRFSINDYEQYGQTGINFLGFDPLNLNHAFVAAHRGQDTLGVHLIDVTTGEFLETVFQHPDVDVLAPVFTQNVESTNELAGFGFYLDGEVERVYIDADMQAVQNAVDAAFPSTRNRILDCFEGCSTMIVQTQGARDPGTYYLIRNGRAQVVGREYPALEPEQLGDMGFVRYPARDGREIPGILTMPAFGEAPYPLVVLPHGGPWVSETHAYDEWTQVLASHGYMVLQPQYRGSEGYGLDHWLASWGQWGYTMQDDKDDGAMFLVEEGLADPDRLAMFGWSYGGYAAFAATVRTEQIYQCSIAGAGVSDISRIQADFTQNRISRLLIREGYRGLDPSENTADANIPILVIHGEVDQRVPIFHSERMVDGLQANNKPYRYIVLEDADHFSNTIDFDNQMILYSELLNWLSGPCGMATEGNQPGQYASTLGQPVSANMP